MKKKITTGTDKEQMIADLRSRLDWFANEASAEEYNEAEVMAIKELLGVLCPETSGDKLEESLGGFWKTKEIRAKIRWEKFWLRSGEVSLADYPDDEKDGDVNMEADKEVATKKKTYRFFRRSSMYKGIVAAALVVALFLGGTAGAYAQKSGFFFWVKRSKSGTEIITSPENIDNCISVSAHYNALEEVPEEYKGYTWKPAQLPQGMEFIHYEVYKEMEWDRVLSLYKNDKEELRLEFISRVFAPGIEYHLQNQIPYDFLCSKEFNGTILEFFEKNSDDETEYMVSFLHNHVQYMVQGNLPLKEIESLVFEYCREIIK